MRRKNGIKYKFKRTKYKYNWGVQLSYIDSILEHSGEEYKLSSNYKLSIFKNIIFDIGVGAKTSVYFSHFAIVNNNCQKPKDCKSTFLIRIMHS